MKYKYKDLVQINDEFFGDYFKYNPSHNGIIIDVRSTGKYSEDRAGVAYEYLVRLPEYNSDHWIYESKLLPGKIYIPKS